MFNNTTSFPLLLVTALDETGIPSSLIVADETTREAIERSKSYFLVFSTVSSCLTFAVGPRLIDTEHAAEPDKHDAEGPLLPNHVAEAEEEDGHEETSRLLPREPAQSAYFSFGPPDSFFPSKRKLPTPRPLPHPSTPPAERPHSFPGLPGTTSTPEQNGFSF